VEAISDGTSNTLLMTEIAGRGLALYVEGRIVAPIGSTVTIIPPVGDVDHYIRGSWCDQSGTPRLRGYAVTATSVDETGCRMVNVTNHDSPFSFHTGGVNALRCDGSVGFVRQSITPPVLIAFITRASGEAVTIE
jgi:prepilin-type processing-associated H-X9-DG protein